MLINSFRLNTDYFLELFEDLPRYKIISQLYGINNHPIWLIGHLTCSFDLLDEVLGGTRLTNEKWEGKFGTGSRPMPIATMYPKPEDLIKLYTQARDKLIDSVMKMSMVDFARPNDVPNYKAYLPTYGDLLTHIMIGHTQYHTGQLVAYRTVHELVRVPEKFDKSQIDKKDGAYFECPICDKRFTSRLTFSKHLKSHESEHDCSTDSETHRTQGAEPVHVPGSSK